MAVTFAQYERKSSPTVVSCDIPVKSTVLKEQQQLKNLFPILETCCKPLRLIVPRLSQYARKWLPTSERCHTRGSVMLVRDLLPLKKLFPIAETCFRPMRSTVVRCEHARKSLSIFEVSTDN